MHVNSESKEHLHGFGYTPSFAKVVKRNEVQECHDTLVMVLERGSLNYRGDPVIVGCVKDFKTLLNIHNVCFDRVIWIDVEGMPLQAWSHATFNRITSKWGKLVYMDDTNASNKYIMRLCVKTRVFDFGEDDIAQFEDGSDNNSVGIHKWEEENDGLVIPYSFQSIVNEYNIMKNSLDHVENSPVKILANRLRLVIDKLTSHERFAFIKGAFSLLISLVVISSSIDHWYWRLNGHGDFSIKSAKEEIDTHLLVTSSFFTRLSKLLPIKLNVFTWRMFLDKLPTRINLSKRGLDVPCVLCPNYRNAVKSFNHLFFGCLMAMDLFRLLGRWWNIDIINVIDPFSRESWFNGIQLNNLQKLAL
uniref:RNA-directed DNA polymerase, eukaryota, reverse transcriptase zinc-binding domain protein n=1 Tax=Tanacetum cinerariifolium TaxID=118510 RepID=A0A699HEQ6_TANCI|nr:RNA-directed DNA polymerase, eukaryota, reverse transcriptase zinc-binding domain protein [Tanacetum cinerariifolium]